MLLRLTVTAGPDAGRVYEIKSGELLLVGSGEECAIQINDPLASKVHCRIYAQGGRIRVVDVRSQSGIRVNGRQVTEEQLQPGDVVSLGATQFRVEVVSQPAASTVAPGDQNGCRQPAPNPRASVRAILYLPSGAAPAGTYELREPGPILIGRSRDCHVRLGYDKVSRHHCLLTYRRGRWCIEDLGSTNGTYLNGKKVARSELTDGDLIRVGAVQVRYRCGQVDDAPGAAAPTETYSPEAGHELAASETSRTSEMQVRDRRVCGRRFGRRYEVKELIHQGSTGLFYRAKDAHGGRTVCLKVLSKSVVGKEADLRRFVRGVRTAAKLHHQNIVQIYRAGRSGADWWIAMEYVNGPSVRELVAKFGIGNMLAPGRVLNIARDVVAALEIAYEHQVLHRNIRPDNILLTRSGTAKLSDFTLTRGVVLSTLQQITGSSELVGDLAYMAPERTDPGGIVDCRSDIYALGACLYSLLAGRAPFRSHSTVHMIELIRMEQPVPPSRLNLSVPAPLEGLVLRCLAKSPTDRFQNPMELRAELARVERYQGLWS